MDKTWKERVNENKWVQLEKRGLEKPKDSTENNKRLKDSNRDIKPLVADDGTDDKHGKNS